jgi:hypothetical protein
MKYKILLLVFTGLSAYLFGQTNKGKDLIFRVKTEKTSVKIFPDQAWIDAGIVQTITVRIKPAGRRIGKVTFTGGTITGKDSTYELTAGTGTEGILSVYEKTGAGNKLILNKVYQFKKTTVQAMPKAKAPNWQKSLPFGHGPRK